MSFKKRLGSTLLTLLLIPFFSCAQPVITSVSPDNINANSTTTVTIKGSGFLNGSTTVHFGYRPATVLTLTDHEITVTSPTGSPGAVDITVSNDGGQSAIGLSDLFSYTTTGVWTAFVTDDASNPFNKIATFQAEGTPPSISLSSIPFDNPEFIAITKDGQRGFVGSTNSDVLYFFDTKDPSTCTAVTNWPAGYVPHGIAIAEVPEEQFFIVYVGAVDASGNGHLIQVASPFIPNTINPSFPDPFVNLNLSLGSGVTPYGLAISPQSIGRVFVADRANGNVLEVTNIQGNTFPPSITTTSVGTNPQCISLTPDGNHVYVTVKGANKVVGFDSSQTPAVLDPVPINVGTNPIGIAVTPDGQKVYVANNGSGTVSVFDVGSQTVSTTVNVGSGGGSGPWGLAITPVNNAELTELSSFGVPLASAIAFVVLNTDQQIQPIATDTDVAGAVFGIGVFHNPEFIAILPDPSPVAHFSVTPTPVVEGEEVVFDASASFSPIGSVVIYEWAFNDGSPILITTDSVVTHVFNRPGLFDVFLRLENSAGTPPIFTQGTETFTGQTVSQVGVEPDGGLTFFTSQTVNVEATVFPVTNFRGVQIAVKFLTQTDLTNILTWNLPDSGAIPEVYLVFRDGVLIGTVSGDPPKDGSGIFHFEDHNRTKGVTYFYQVVSVDEAGNQSFSLSVPVTPL